ncbi:hypothetical protein C8R44DRAFT_812365 [Mycena epipterygia]|nr:hypothetical protein C8R44DRAFT_812365 [Mycena epipterygia]
MPLRRLSAQLWTLFPSSPDLSHPLFVNLTHLTLQHLLSGVWDSWSGLVELPGLTHLSFYNSAIDLSIYHGTLIRKNVLFKFVPSSDYLAQMAKFSKF